MTDPFRQFFLESVYSTIQQQPSTRGLVSLLKFSNSHLTLEELRLRSGLGSGSGSAGAGSMEDLKRDIHKHIKVLKSRIHPDKHNAKRSDKGDSGGGGGVNVTKLFQDVQIFYNDCMEIFTSEDHDGNCSVDGTGRPAAANGKKKHRRRKNNGDNAGDGNDRSGGDMDNNIDGDDHGDNNDGSSRRGSKRRRKRQSSSSTASTSSSKSSMSFPDEFSICTQWPNTAMAIATSIPNDDNDKRTKHKKDKDRNGSPSVSSNEQKRRVPNGLCPPIYASLTRRTVPVYQAYRALHARGAIAHGKEITLFHSWDEIVSKHLDNNDSNKKKEGGLELSSVYDVFDQCGGVTKELDTVEAIKEEIMHRGPVVSVSFQLSAVYLKQWNNMITNSNEGAFANDLMGDVHELLIVGWRMTGYGEAWEVQPLMDDCHVNFNGTSTSEISLSGGNTNIGANVNINSQSNTNTNTNNKSTILIGFGQFGIDDLCLAPMSNMEDRSWQPGPYFTSDFSEAPHWREWNEMDLPLLDVELKQLAKCFTNGHGLMSGDSFVIRDGVKKAHSSNYKVKNLRWEDAMGEWNVTVCRDDS
mmetsp:Transcript_11031/g.16684  ORF Transcript_11031/g.16684 Transcript_11031/m.16684 type:complete len:581 (+) Transcript_11031:111-1853(+)|eukprot:CAMPEP_0194090702 /NCGR_PEP_ID=MMETSP0149-20130528/40276_1 /TAXON_ID=122233 /ORGANISM="Chaetoceros debilis, Strain MM31A-1" /LENGTH=580 /DNA_ID=CAMNT_0038775063 /DNA_START=55 /DNA_END=1797 /DNA_ORIENTATION=-